MDKATPSSWKILPPPELRQPLGFEADFTDGEYAMVIVGLIPKQMEDKWFIYYQDGALNFHRSWTGAHI